MKLLITMMVTMMAIWAPIVVHAGGPLQEVSVDDIALMKIAAQDERAVVKTPDGRLHVIKVGDAVGKSGKVVEVAEGRVVLEEMGDRGIETVIIRVEDGEQRIERIRRVGEAPPGLNAPR